MVDLHYLGVSEEEISWVNRLSLLSTPYVTTDGMNEYGLAVGQNFVPCRIPIEDPQKVTILSNHIMRLVLDYAKNVDEAIALIKEYNVKFPEV